jgi:hypothetical protein
MPDEGLIEAGRVVLSSNRMAVALRCFKLLRF